MDIRWLLPRAVRLRFDGGDDPCWLSVVAPAIASPAPTVPALTIAPTPEGTRIARADGTVLCVVDGERRDGRVTIRSLGRRGEIFSGGGEWFDAFGRTTGRLRLRARESPAVLQHRRTYSTIPFFVSTRGYGLLLLNGHASDWTFDAATGAVTITADGPPADLVVIDGPTPREVVAAYTALTGRAPLVPRWAFGLWVTGYPQSAQDEVVRHVDEHRRRDVPLDAVILDYHWEARFHDFRWRPGLFPDPERLVADLRARGVRLGLIFTPFLNTENLPAQRRVLNWLVHALPAGHEHDDERALAEYGDARRRGFLAHARVRWWFGRGGMLDFTNPAAAAWWNAKLRPLYDAGVAFFKNDDGEYLPDDARSHLGMEGREYHNQYGFHYGRALFEGMAALDDRRALVFARSVWMGSQRYPALFLGDQRPSFACLRATIRAALNLAMSGFAYWGADVFGLEGRTTPETHMRYAQWALMGPIARYFIRPPARDGTRFPWSHDETVAASFRRHATLRSRLLPYYTALGWEAAETGIPLVRPLGFEFPDDRRLDGVDDQVLLGDALLLAPVVQPGATRRAVVLPAGTWHDWWTTASWAGATIIAYPAPLDRLPLLARGGRIVPLGTALACIPDTHRFDALELHCWPPWPAHGVVRDDDGASRAWERGIARTIRVAVEPVPGGVRLAVAAATGLLPPTRIAWTFVLHRTTPPWHVQAPHPLSWTYDVERATTTVAFPLDSTRATSVLVTWPDGSAR